MWLCTCTVPSIVPHRSSINTRHDSANTLGDFPFSFKMAAKTNARQASGVLSCQHHGHVTALSDLCVQCDDVERGGRSECASDW